MPALRQVGLFAKHAEKVRRRDSHVLPRPRPTAAALWELFVHHLGLFGLGQLVGFVFEFLGKLLDLVLGLFAFVFGECLVLLLLFGQFVGVAADVADGDLGLLGQFL